MVALSEYNKERVYFHLGFPVSRFGLTYGDFYGTDAFDIRQVEHSCSNITSDYMHNQVLDQLDRCDRALNNIEMIERGTKASISEVLIGDVNRTRETLDLNDVNQYRKEYEYQRKTLARILACPYYGMEDMGEMAYRYARNSGSYIATVTGVADTSTSSRLVEYNSHLHGAAGV